MSSGISFADAGSEVTDILKLPNVQLRAARLADVEGVVQLFRNAYADSSHPCKDPDFVRSTVGSSSFEWSLAADGNRIVACSASVEHLWNRTWEIGRGVTDPRYRGCGLGARLCQLSVTAACGKPTCDFIHGFPRNSTIARIAASSQPALLLTGHDGAINVANGVREYHGVIFGRNPNATFRHFIPRSESLAQTAFVRRAVFDALRLHPEPGPYPATWIAGRGTAPSGGHPFSVEHDPRCLSSSLEVTGYHGSARTAPEFIHELLDTLAHFPAVTHSRLAVLADKTTLISDLAGNGFEPTAYLPAWHWRDEGRFDCVLMVRRHFTEEPAAYGLGDAVREFRKGLASC